MSKTILQKFRVLFLFPLSVFPLLSCNFQPPPDPNDPADGTVLQAEVMQRNLNWASESLSSRVFQRQLTRAEADARLQEFASHLAESIPRDAMAPMDAWRYGEVLRTAKQWDRAEAVYRMAAEQAQRVKDEDRYANDTLHYAEALAENGKVNEAISAVRSTFSVSAKSKAPILFGTLYQVVPAAKDSVLNIDLAGLLEDAIEQHRQVIVNANTMEGASFISTRQYHVMKAWQKVIELYREANRPDLAERARAKRDNSGMIGI
jgi:tetratricopeptide (TPR) repeat protein